MTSTNEFTPLDSGPVVASPAPRLDIAARAYLGTPFLHQGRDPAIGIDCVGLVALCVRDCGLSHLLSHDFTSYHRNPAHGELERRLRAALGAPVTGGLRPGDVVSMSFAGQTRHVGVIGAAPDGRPSLIHTYNKPAKVIEHGIDDKWRRRITGIYRVESQ